MAVPSTDALMNGRPPASLTAAVLATGVLRWRGRRRSFLTLATNRARRLVWRSAFLRRQAIFLRDAFTWVIDVLSGVVCLVLGSMVLVVWWGPRSLANGWLRMSCASGQLGKLISLVFGKKVYQEAFPFSSQTRSRSFKNIKITETESIAYDREFLRGRQAYFFK